MTDPSPSSLLFIAEKEKGPEVLAKLHADTKATATTLNAQHRDLYSSSGRYIKFLEKVPFLWMMEWQRGPIS